MLTSISKKRLRAAGTRIAIVASEYNAKYVDSMLRAAKSELRRAGVEQPLIVRVPGAYEIPVVAARLASVAASDGERGRVSAIICLGVILRGETTHAAHIGEAVSQALMQIQLEHHVPVIHEVLLLENEEQARARCLGSRHNRGLEAAQTALSMAKVMQRLGASSASD
jgi:6,7-dimethyl-8-ribityllumazine synthase